METLEYGPHWTEILPKQERDWLGKKNLRAVPVVRVTYWVDNEQRRERYAVVAALADQVQITETPYARLFFQQTLATGAEEQAFPIEALKQGVLQEGNHEIRFELAGFATQARHRRKNWSYANSYG